MNPDSILHFFGFKSPFFAQKLQQILLIKIIIEIKENRNKIPVRMIGIGAPLKKLATFY